LDLAAIAPLAGPLIHLLGPFGTASDYQVIGIPKIPPAIHSRSTALFGVLGGASRLLSCQYVCHTNHTFHRIEEVLIPKSLMEAN
jgi:hypothetical protein